MHMTAINNARPEIISPCARAEIPANATVDNNISSGMPNRIKMIALAIFSSISPADQCRIRRPAPFDHSAVVPDERHAAICKLALALFHGLGGLRSQLVLSCVLAMLLGIAGHFECLAAFMDVHFSVLLII